MLAPRSDIAHDRADPGEYTIVVKVIDILGNDTTKTVKAALRPGHEIGDGVT